MIVAIDGPVGSGKTTTAKGVAKRLNFVYLDTGALYRTVALFADMIGIGMDNIEDICDKLSEIELNVFAEGNNMVIELNGRRITNEIRTPKITHLSSPVSALPCVREFLLETQRNFSKYANLVCEGRDIGTVIFPNAEVKIFLDASVSERAKRRYSEYIKRGENVSYEDVVNMIMERDIRDTCRKIAPLRKAEDAILLDTTGMSLEDQINAVIDIIRREKNV